MNGSQLYCILLDMLLPAGQEDDLQVRKYLVVQELLLRIYKQLEGKYCVIVGKFMRVIVRGLESGMQIVNRVKYVVGKFVLCGHICGKVKALIALSLFFSITGIVFTLIQYNWRFTKPRPPWLLILLLSSFCTCHVKY